MRRPVYLALAEISEAHLLRAMPHPVEPNPEALPDFSCAVYAVEDRQGEICYVGSVYRPDDLQGLASHVREYLRDEVRTAIYYAFARHGIEIPFPIQVEYSREWVGPDVSARQRNRDRLLAGVDLFAGLTEEQRREIAAATIDKVFGHGEAIVRQGSPGSSMFVVGRGTAVVTLEPHGQEVATIHAGGYFGEMSLLTGEPRTATVVARGDTHVIEIDAGLFRQLGAAHPHAIEQIAAAAVTRRTELEQIRTASHGSAVADAPATLVARMKKFLGL